MLQNFHILPPSPYLWPTMSSSISTVSKFHSVEKRLSKTSFWYSQHTNDVSITSLWHPQRTKDIFMFTRHKKQIFPKRVYDSYQFPLKLETIDCIYKKIFIWYTVHIDVHSNIYSRKITMTGPFFIYIFRVKHFMIFITAATETFLQK